MKAIIHLDVPEWQIGQEVTVYFPDTMQKKGTCEQECKGCSTVFDVAYKAGKESIVRCKDCKWFEMPRFGERGYCKNLDIIRETTFYCADGERKET